MGTAPNRTRLSGSLAKLAAVIGARWRRLMARRTRSGWPSREEFAEMEAGTLNEYFASIGAEVRVQDQTSIARRRD
jgi:hypothetical protein